MKKVLVTHCGQNDGCQYYRVTDVYSSLKSEKIEFVIPKENILSDDVFNYDAILLQRPSADGISDAIKKIKERNIKVIVETDDALDLIPLSNPAHKAYSGKTLKNYKECLALADYIHTSTPELHKKGVVFPNAVDLNKYTLRKSTKTRTVSWQGSPTHTDSLMLIKPVFEELLRNNVNVVLIGDGGWLRTMFNDDAIKIVDWLPFSVSYFAPAMADICLAPLPDTAFNRAKSELRVIEAAAWGIPSVCSPVAPYNRFNTISGGGNIVVKEKFSCWVEAIMSLLDDDKLYDYHSTKSYEAVKNFYNLELINEKRKQWWHSTLCV